MSEWQPIETAPDDEAVLGWDSFMECPRIIRRLKPGKCRDDWDGSEAMDISHWKPLPEGPK